jgi:hypothetical protein
MRTDGPGTGGSTPAAERAEVRLSNVGARRRPSGEPPPLPREPGWRSWAWATLALLVAGVAIHLAIVESDAQSPVLRWFQDQRTPALVDLAEALDALSDPLVIWIIRVVVLVIAALFKRWRHLVTILALYVVVDFLDTILAAQRTAPEGVSVLSSNATTVFPSFPVAALSVTLFGAVMVLAPSGRPRRLARRRLRGHGARRPRPVAPRSGLPR